MSSWSARYVKLAAKDGSSRAEAVARVMARVDPGAKLLDDGKSAFVVWLAPTPKFEPADLATLSKDFGEAFAIGVQSVADLIVYDHFVAGAPVRRLTYAGEAGWTRVVGTPEPWEGRTLFSSTRLVELFEALEDDFSGEELDREKAELEALWERGALEEGNNRPSANPEVLGRAIEKHFGLPAKPSFSSASLPRH